MNNAETFLLAPSHFARRRCAGCDSSSSNPSAVHSAVAHCRSRQQEWGRRDLNPRSTDISGSCASELQRVVNAGGDQPPARYISLESRLGRGGLWSQSPCRAWPRPRAHHFPGSLQMDFDTRGRRSRPLLDGVVANRLPRTGHSGSTAPATGGRIGGPSRGRRDSLETPPLPLIGRAWVPTRSPTSRYRSVSAQSQSWHFQPVTSSVTDGM